MHLVGLFGSSMGVVLSFVVFSTAVYCLIVFGVCLWAEPSRFYMRLSLPGLSCRDGHHCVFILRVVKPFVSCSHLAPDVRSPVGSGGKVDTKTQIQKVRRTVEIKGLGSDNMQRPPMAGVFLRR
jgi:hypothetical protein